MAVINSAIGIALSAFLDGSGNLLYRSHAQKKINVLKDTHRNEADLESTVKQHGGTSWLGVLAAIALLVCYLFVAGFLTEVIYSIVG